MVDRVPILFAPVLLKSDYEDIKPVLLLVEAYGIIGGRTCLMSR
jgi:hypothetical protein